MLDAIRQLGGIRPAAKALGVPHTTVWNWNDKGKIPAWRWPQVEAALRAQEDFSNEDAGRGDGSSGR